MVYETQHTGMSASGGGYESTPFCNVTEIQSHFGSVSNPVSEFYSVGIDETIGLKEKIEDVQK